MTNYPFPMHRDQLISEVMQNGSLEPTEKLIAVIMASRHVCEGTGYTFAPISLIAKEAGASEDTVALAIERLQEEGFLRIVGVVDQPEEKCYAL